MNSLARTKLDSIERKRHVFRTVVSYFGELEDSQAIDKVSAAVDFAYTDDLLFEDFEIWMEERNDAALLFQVDHFFETKDKKPLSKANLTGNAAEIEKIKEDAEQELAQVFAQKLKALANQRGLKTEKEIGDFLGKTQQQVHSILAAEHKPQRKTLLLVAEKFHVTLEFLVSE